MDGTNRSVIVQDHITWPNGLTLDFINDRIYWADAREDYIEFASLDGTNRHKGYYHYIVIMQSHRNDLSALTTSRGTVWDIVIHV